MARAEQWVSRQAGPAVKWFGRGWQNSNSQSDFWLAHDSTVGLEVDRWLKVVQSESSEELDFYSWGKNTYLPFFSLTPLLPFFFFPWIWIKQHVVPIALFVHEGSQNEEEAIKGERQLWQTPGLNPSWSLHTARFSSYKFPYSPITVGFSSFLFPQHKRAPTDIGRKQICGWVILKGMCLLVASKSGRVEKLVLLFTRRIENLSSGDGSPGPRVDLNSSAMSAVSFQQIEMSLVLRGWT